MITLTYIALILIFGIIIYEDLNTRLVHWVLFPVLTFLLGWLFYNKVGFSIFVMFTSINIMIISLLLFILFLYAKWIIKLPFLNTVFGLGDLLFFYALSMAFPTITFIILFVSALIFSLLLHLVIKKKKTQTTVPLAGYMSVFIGTVFCTSLFIDQINLYQF